MELSSVDEYSIIFVRRNMNKIIFFQADHDTLAIYYLFVLLNRPNFVSWLELDSKTGYFSFQPRLCLFLKEDCIASFEWNNVCHENRENKNNFWTFNGYFLKSWRSVVGK